MMACWIRLLSIPPKGEVEEGRGGIFLDFNNNSNDDDDGGGWVEKISASWVIISMCRSTVSSI